MTEVTELAAALAAFQKDLPRVGKGQTATVPTKTGGSYSYSYADLASLTHEVLPKLNEHGLTFVTAPRSTEQGYAVAGILLHTSGQSIEAALPLYGRSPQEIGSALTYARRYLLGCLTGVVTEDDDDAQRAKQADRTSKKDWDAIVDTALGIKDVDALQDLWRNEQVSKAPQSVQTKIKAHGDELRKQADLDKIAEQENAASEQAAAAEPADLEETKEVALDA
jgi:hypothetical protein